MTATTVARVIGVLAAILIVVSGVLGSGFSPLAIPFIVWALLPYVALLFVPHLIANPWVIGGAGAAALAVESGIRASVFLYPRGSTAAIALVFSPVLIAAIAMPVGALAGWLFGHVYRGTNVVVRIGLVCLAWMALSLTYIGFARPEMFPTKVLNRERHLREIGEPRIVMGGDRFARAVVSEVSGWRQVGEFDDQPGEDLAIVEHNGAQLFDAVSLKPARFIPFGGEPGRLWNWYSQLVRLGDSLVVVQTGGGFQKTQVMSLNNELLWSFHPDEKLPPTALRPGDLDGDGEMEFYASTTNAITRLNTRGEPVWSKPSTLPHLVALAPKDDRTPAWIVSTRYQAAVDIWSPDGTQLAEVKWPGPVHDVVTWPFDFAQGKPFDFAQGKPFDFAQGTPFDFAQGKPAARRLLVGDSSAKGVDLNGSTAFEIPIDEPLQLMQALAWQPDSGPALLAVLAGGDSDLRRWRLRVYESPESVVYDEVFDSPPRLLAAKHADGTSTLFVITGAALTVLKPQNN